MQYIASRAARFTREIMNSDVAKKLLTHILEFLSGFLFSRSVVFSVCSPFGAAFLASVPYKSLFISLAGSIMGYLLSESVIPARYIAAVIAISAIRWTLSELNKVNTHVLFAPVLTFLGLFVPSLSVALVNESLHQYIAIFVSEALLGAGSSFFFSGTFAAIKEKRFFEITSLRDISSIIFSLTILSLSLIEIKIYGISLIKAIFLSLIMLAAYKGGVAAGSIFGTAAGVIFGLSNAGVSYFSGSYAISGLLCGMFSALGKLASAAAFVVSYTLSSLQIGAENNFLISFYEVSIAAIIYLALPKNAFSSVKFPFISSFQTNENDIKNFLCLKLSSVAYSLKSVFHSLEKLFPEVDTSKEQDSELALRAASSVCKNCGFKTLCWEKNTVSVKDAFLKLSKLCKSGEKTEIYSLPEYFNLKCCRVPEIHEFANKSYEEEIIKNAADKRYREIRSVIADQFSVSSGIICELAEEIKHIKSCDEKTTSLLISEFKKQGISFSDCICRVESAGNISISISSSLFQKDKLSSFSFLSSLKKITGRDFSPPAIIKNSGTYIFTFCEKARLSLLYSTSRHCFGGKSTCGDSVLCFFDSKGLFYALLADGMGTGGKAAVNASLCVNLLEKLILAGIGCESAIRIVNSALIVKSGEEEFTALDILKADLYTGECTFYKAGASTSFVLKSGNELKIEGASLPIGILPEAEISKEKLFLKSGDTAVLVSDGAIASGDEWIFPLIKNEENTDVSSLADKLVIFSQKERNDGHDDDITAVVIKFVPEK